MCIRQFTTEMVDISKWLGLGLGFQFLCMIEEGEREREREREEQGDLSVALVLWGQNRRFLGVWVNDEMGAVAFWCAFCGFVS
jgi:hypothetical protein